jgi:hypothetical protein
VSADRTKTFLVESYVRQLDEPTAAVIAARVEGAAAELRSLGLPVVWLRSLALPGEETYFCLFSAEMVEHVIAANERAGLEFDHITEVVTIEPGT